MQRPDILTIQDNNFLNPLYGYTTRENLVVWYRDFQTLGRLAIQWIQTAQRQTLQLGPGTGWDWEAHQGHRLRYPDRHLIVGGRDMGQSNYPTRFSLKLTEHHTAGDVDFLSDTTSGWGTDDESSLQNSKDLRTENLADEGRSVVLHPTKSAYAARYPDFDPFAGQPLIDNGYVTAGNNQCQALIIHTGSTLNQDVASIDYLNTLFSVHHNDMEE